MLMLKLIGPCPRGDQQFVWGQTWWKQALMIEQTKNIELFIWMEHLPLLAGLPPISHYSYWSQSSIYIEHLGLILKYSKSRNYMLFVNNTYRIWNCQKRNIFHCFFAGSAVNKFNSFQSSETETFLLTHVAERIN